MKTSELTKAVLNWAVAKCEFEGCEDWDGTLEGVDSVSDMQGKPYSPSTDWSQGGPIIEREAIQITPDEYKGTWTAYMTDGGEPYEGTGPTPLIAAMRCFVVSKLGNEIEVPEDSNKEQV